MNRFATSSSRHTGVLRRTAGLFLLLGFGLALSGCLRTVQVEPDVMIVLPSNQGVTHLESGQSLLVQNYWWYHPRVHPWSYCHPGIYGARCHPIGFHGPVSRPDTGPAGPGEGGPSGDVLPVTFPSTTVGAVAIPDPKELPVLRLEELNWKQRMRLGQELRSLMHEQREASGDRSQGSAFGFDRRFVGTPYSPVEATDLVVKVRGSDGKADITRKLPITVVSDSSWSASITPRRVNDKVPSDRFAISTGPSALGSGMRSSPGFTRQSGTSTSQVSRSSSMRSSAPRSTRPVRPSTTAKIER